MRNEIALRYLLLRHVKSCENKAPKSIFIEVSKSLQVSEDAESYIVNWQIAGKERVKKISKKEFQFYQRGDLNPEGRSINEDLSTNNDAIASSFALEALDIKTDNPRQETRKVETNTIDSILEHIVFALILVLLGGVGYFSGVVLLAILLVEYFHNGRLYASILFVIFAFTSHGAALTGSIIYAALQFLDPNPFSRNLRILLNTAAFLVALLLIQSVDWMPSFYFKIYFLAVILFALLISGFGSLFSIHYGAMSLTLPFVSAGFILDNRPVTAIVGLLLSISFTIRSGYFSKH